MFTLNDILLQVKKYFQTVGAIEEGSPCHFSATIEEGIKCEVVVKLDKETNERTFIKEIASKKEVYNKEGNPSILVTEKDGKLQFGILGYLEYGGYFYNKDINLRRFNEKNIEWLKLQLGAKRMEIVSLPKAYWRVVKTIELNSTQLVEGRVVYLRKLKENDYEMKPVNKSMDYLERFNRNLYGTPQEEYPEDELDKLILKKIQDDYPSAKVKSRLLLFQNELLDLRYYKDKIMIPKSINFINKDSHKQIKLEYYYYPNLRFSGLQPNMLNEKIPVVITHIGQCDSYEPLSSINI